MKRVISIITLTALLLSMLITGPVSAAEDNKLELKKAIEIAKTAFNFDTTNLDLNSSYSETKYGRKLWFLNWNSKQAPGTNFSVTVDAASGEIINMNQWDNNIAASGKIPKYTKAEALKVAEDLAKRLHPNKFKDLELMNDYQNTPYRSYYPNESYIFYFMRKVNGIDFQDNGIQVQVDKNTLKVRYFSLEWDTVIPIPDSKNAIKSDAAKKIYAEKLGLELAYNMIYPNGSTEPKLMLVYSQKNSNSPIDALTGQIITIPYYGPMYGMQEKYALDSRGGMGAYTPTPQEQKVIDDASKYISKEKAIEALKKYITVDSKYNMDNSSLYGGQNNETATWNFGWSYNDKTNNTYAYISGAVDAVTGEVKNFYTSGSETENKPKGDPKYTKEQCREIAEKFLKGIQSGRFKNSEYREQYYDMNMNPKNVVNYNLNFVRKEAGIAVPFNNMSVTVNAYTGKIIGFNMNWNNLEFPDAKGIISLEDAYKKLYVKHDLMLKYIRMYNYDMNGDNTTIRLAYMLDNFYGMIDAKSGQIVDFNGNPIVEADVSAFTDIAGHKYENSIKLLVELGIIDSGESKFNPDSKILQKDFVKLLMKATQPDYYPIPYTSGKDSEYDKYYENAILQNILAKKDKNPEAYVAKLEASKMAVKALGAGFVADFGNMFNLNLKDASNITVENKGYAAIAAALGIADTSNGSFEPALQLTRGDAAGMILKYLMVEKTPKDSQASAGPAVLPVLH